MRGLRDRGYKLAICTNNVREWEPLWRASSRSTRSSRSSSTPRSSAPASPSARIYEITLERLGVPAQRRADDRRHRAQLRRPPATLGMRAVWFRRHRAGDRGDRSSSCASRRRSAQFSTPRRSQQYSSRHSRASSAAALLRQPRQHRVERLLLPHPGLERLLAAEARGDLQRLAAVLAQRREHVDEELLVRDRMADLQRRVPRGQHRQVVLVEVGDRLGVVGLELGLRDLVHPGPHDFAEDLPTRLAPDGLGDDSYGVLRFDEAEGHRGSGLEDADAAEGRWWRGRNRPRATGPARPESTRGVGVRIGLGVGRRARAWRARRAPSWTGPGPAPPAGSAHACARSAARRSSSSGSPIPSARLAATVTLLSPPSSSAPARRS